MSRIESGRPADPRRVNYAPAAPRTGITERLETPGLVTPPPVSRGAILAQQLSAALGAVGDLAYTADRMVDRSNRKIERELAQAEADNEKAAQLDKGHGSLVARTLLPQIRDQFDKRDSKVIRPDGVTVDEWASRLASAYTADQTDAYRDGFNNIFLPSVTEAIVGFESRVAAQATDENLDLVRGGMEAVANSEELAAFVDTKRGLFPKLTDQEFYSKTLLPAMEAAARRGDSERFDLYQAELKDKNGNPIAPEIQERYRATLESSRQGLKQQATESMRNADSAAELDGATFERRREIVKGFRGNVDDSDIAARLREIDSQERQFRNENDHLIKLNEINAGRASMLAQDSVLAAAGQAWAIDDGAIKHADGTVTNVDRKARVDAAMGRRFAEIQAKYPDDPRAARLEMIQSAALNGYTPEPWARLLSAGYSAASDLTLNGDASKGEPSLPPHTIAALDLYRDLKAIGPGLLNDSMVPPRAKELYERTITLMQDPAIGSENPQAAMLAARRDMARGISGEVGASARQRITSAAKSIADVWGTNNARNPGEIANRIERWTRIYTSRGMDETDAVKKSTETVKGEGVVINGWWTPVGTMNLPGTLREDINKTAELVLGTFAEKHKQYLDDRGLDESDLSLVQDQSTGMWIAVDAANGLPIVIPGKPDETMFTNKALIDKADELRRGDILRRVRGTPSTPAQPVPPRHHEAQANYESGRGRPPFARD